MQNSLPHHIQKDLGLQSPNQINSRQELIESINSYYQGRQPFKESQTISDRLNQIVKLIGFATIAESLEIIDKWGVELRKNTSSQDFKDAIAVFSAKYKDLGQGTWVYSERLINQSKG